jgi:hypothetical protein
VKVAMNGSADENSRQLQMEEDQKEAKEEQAV